MSPHQIERFWRSTRREGDCLIWTKSLRVNGYGQANIDGKNRTVHRVAYQLALGPIPDGMKVDHRCRRRACIEPAHLRLATTKQNAENIATDRASSSGVRGVTWDRERGKWQAKITHNYRTINLGRYDDLAEAARVAQAARDENFTHADKGVAA